MRFARTSAVSAFIAAFVSITGTAHASTASDYDAAVAASAPSAYYKLDETSGATASSTPANTMSASGSLTWSVPGAMSGSTAARFAAAGILSLNGHLNLDNISVEGWMKPSAASQTSAAFCNGYDWSGFTYGTCTGLNGTKIYGGEIGSSIFNTPFAPGTGLWHHVVVQRASGKTEVWVDAVKQTGSTTGYSGTGANFRLSIGGLYQTSPGPRTRLFSGDIDNVAFYNHTLSQADITAHYEAGLDPPSVVTAPTTSGTVRPGRTLYATTGSWTPGTPTYTYQWQHETSPGTWEDISGANSSTYVIANADLGLRVRVQVTATTAGGSTTASTTATATVVRPQNQVEYYEDLVTSAGAYAYYPLDESSGATAHDVAGLGRDAALTGSVGSWSAPGPIPGSFAVSLTGTGYFRAASMLPQTSESTVEAWAAADTLTPGLQYIAGNGHHWNGFDYGPWLKVKSDGRFHANSTGWPIDTTSAFGISAWHHLAIRRTAGVTSVFFDGVKLPQTAAAVDAIDASFDRMSIGGAYRRDTSGTAGLFSGDIDNVAFYDTALTDQQIHDHAHADVIAPHNTAVPTISGTPDVGQVLTGTTGTWYGGGTITYTYQWQRETSPGTWTDIAGETSSSYTVDPADAAAKLRVNVTAANSAGSSSAVSAATTQVGGQAPSNDTVPTISGDAAESKTLTADPGTWDGTAPLAYAYQWQVEATPGVWTDIGGATSVTYIATNADAGSTLRVKVTATNAKGSASAVSAPTETVTAVPQNVTPPTVTGTPTDGQQLTASTGTWSGFSLSYTYQWQRETSPGVWVDIPSETSSAYTASSPDVGHALRVQVTATNTAGSDTQASAATAAVAAVAAVAPTSTAAPQITGTPNDGQTLTTDDGAWNGTTPMTFSYQWQREISPGTWADIAGETSGAYTVVVADAGDRIRVQVTATNAAGAATRASSPTAAATLVVPVSTTPPAITGTVEEGQTLTADDGTWAGTVPMTFTYQWQREISPGTWAAITAAMSSTYKLAGDDVAHKIRVQVTATNAAGNATQASAPTAAVDEQTPQSMTAPAIAGTLQYGHILAADTGTWAGTGAAFSIAWQRCAKDLAGCATVSSGSTYALGSADIGKKMKIVVTATNSRGSAIAAAATAAAISVDAPTLVGAGPKLLGGPLDAAFGMTDTQWDGYGVTVTKRWQRENALGIWEDVAQGDVYAAGPADIGHRIRGIVVASNAELEGGQTVVAVTDPCPIPAQRPAVHKGTEGGDPTIVNPGDPISVDPGQWPDSSIVIIRWQRQSPDGTWQDIQGANERQYTPQTDDRKVRPILQVTGPDGETFQITFNEIRVATRLIVSRVRMIPAPLLRGNANTYKKAAMLRSCKRRGTAARRRACRDAVNLRFRSRLAWQQNIAGTVRYQLVRGRSVLGGGKVTGTSGVNQAGLSKALAAKLNRVSWYAIRFYIGTSMSKKLRFTVRPSVQLVHAPTYRGRRMLTWWQDQPGVVLITIKRHGKVVGTVRTSGRTGTNRHLLGPAMRGRLRPGAYDVEAHLQLGKLKSSASRTKMHVR